MSELSKSATKVGTLLIERGEMVSVAESSTGGLISAALLAVPGASAYFAGGTVVYTKSAQNAFLKIDLPSIPESVPRLNRMRFCWREPAEKLWQQRGVSARVERLDQPTIGTEMIQGTHVSQYQVPQA